MSDTTVTPEKEPILTNRLYDALKFAALVVLPALGALYFGLAEIWGLPKAQEVVGTIVVLDTFLGLVLKAATRNYRNSGAQYDGVMNIFETPDRTQFQMDISKDPEVLSKKDNITFKVERLDEFPE